MRYLLLLAVSCSAPAPATAVQSDDASLAPYAAPDYGVVHVDRAQGARICAPMAIRYETGIAAARWHERSDVPFELLCHEPTIVVQWGDVGGYYGQLVYWSHDGEPALILLTPDLPVRQLIPVLTHELGHALSPVEGPHHHHEPGILGDPWVDEITDADMRLVFGGAS